MRASSWIGFALSLVLMAGLAHSQDDTRGAKTHAPKPGATDRQKPRQVKPYVEGLFRLTETNTNYRKVLFTGALSQLVVMSIPPGESIGTEEHAHVEQTLVIVRGAGQAVLGDERTDVGSGDVIVVTPGTRHNVVNTGKAPLQLFTTYVPPNHIDGRVHPTKKDAERDKEDERYGHEAE